MRENLRRRQLESLLLLMGHQLPVQLQWYRKEEYMHIDEDDLKFKKKISQASRYGVMGLCLGKKLKDELDQYCEDRGIVKAKLIKALLRQYLKDKKNPFLKDE